MNQANNVAADTNNAQPEQDHIFCIAEKYDETLLNKVFSERFLIEFQFLLERKCSKGAALPRAEAAYLLGLTPPLAILTDKEEKSLRARCEKDFMATFAKLGIKLSLDEHKFKASEVVNSDQVTEDQKLKFEEALEALHFDEYEDYRTKRNANLEREAIVGLVINQEIIPGYYLHKGPGGGITANGTERTPGEKKEGSAPKAPKFPEGFVDTAIRALEALCPERTPDQKPTYHKRSVIVQRMSAIWYNEHDKEVKWLGSENENLLSAALAFRTPETTPIYDNYHSVRGIGGGVFRIARGDSKEAIKGKN